MRRYLGGVVVVAAIRASFPVSRSGYWACQALLLGLWVAFTSLIPIFGTYIGIVPALPLALSVSPTTAALAVLAYVLIQQLKDNILTPRVQGETAHVHPVIVLLVVLWVGWAFGLFWSVLAVPALVAVSALVDFFRARVRIRPDPPITPEEPSGNCRKEARVRTLSVGRRSSQQRRPTISTNPSQHASRHRSQEGRRDVKGEAGRPHVTRSVICPEAWWER